MFRNLPQPIIPREHGGWAVLFVPMVIVAFVMHQFPLRLLWLACSGLFLFMSYLPMQILLRARMGTPVAADKRHQAAWWGTLYIVLGVLFAIPLLLEGYWLLLVYAAAGSLTFLGNFYFTRKHPKTIPGDLIAVFGLSLSAPASYYVLAGTINATAIMLRMLVLLYFGGSVFYVHMKIIAARIRKPSFSYTERVAMGKWTLVYYLGSFAILVLLVSKGLLHYGILLAFAPMTLHAVIGTIWMMPKVRFKNLGYLLLAQSVLFGLLLGMLR